MIIARERARRGRALIEAPLARVEDREQEVRVHGEPERAGEPARIAQRPDDLGHRLDQGALEALVQVEQRGDHALAVLGRLEGPTQEGGELGAVGARELLGEGELLEQALGGGEIVEIPQQRLAEGREQARERLAEEAALVAEVPEHRGAAHARALAHVRDRRALVPARHEELGRRRQDALLGGRLSVHSGHARHPSPHLAGQYLARLTGV